MFQDFRFRRAIVLLTMLVMSQSMAVWAAPRATEDLPDPYKIPVEAPKSIEEIHDVVGKQSPPKDGEIFQDLTERAQCGGWDSRGTVAGKVPDYAAPTAVPDNARAYEVRGVPGRVGNWQGNTPSGMAERLETGGRFDDGFVFPVIEDVRGWSTACTPGFPPYLDDKPPCKDADGKATPGQCADICVRVNRWQYPVWTVAAWELRDAEGNVVDRQNKQCTQIGKGEKAWSADPQQGDCCERGGQGNDAPSCAAAYGSDGQDPVFNPFPGSLPPRENPNQPIDDCWNDSPGQGYTPVIQDFHWEYCCTKARVTQLQYEACTLPARDACVRHPDGQRNCVRCEGDGIPSADDPDVDFNGEPVARGENLRKELGCRVGATLPDSPARSRGTFASFFREYFASIRRSPVGDAVPHEKASLQKIPVACYGFYAEFDPKTRATTPQDQRCVIAGYRDFAELPKAELGKGTFFAADNAYDIDPTKPEELRDPQYDPEKDLWYKNLGGGMSLLNGEMFQKEYDGNLTLALMAEDDARLRAAPQISPEQTRSLGDTVRAFDDTVTKERGPKRTVVEWWQRQETQAHRLLHPPTVSIVLPSLRALFVGGASSSSSSQGSASSDDIRSKSIEIQLSMRDDAVGEIGVFLKDSLLLPLTTRPITVVVPTGTATDFRAYKEGWIAWKEALERSGGSTPDGAQAVIDRLEEYAERIDEIRAMRADLALMLAAILKRQGSALDTVGAWIEDNGQAIRLFIRARQDRAELAEEWKNIQKLYREFHDGTNMPWCKNDRYTTPVYSFLDPWLPGRPELTGKQPPNAAPPQLDEGQTPPLTALPELTLDPVRDLWIDLSLFQGAGTTIPIPIVRPIQILADHKTLLPPGIGDPSPTIPTLPPLPPVPRLPIDAESIPEITADQAIVTRYPSLALPENAEQTLAEIRRVIQEMKDTYAQFWDAVMKPMCGTPEGDKRCALGGGQPGDCCVLAGEEEDCRKGWGSDTCVQTESDLLERFTRIAARPAVFFPQDFESKGEERTAQKPTASELSCPPGDWACPDLHGVTVMPQQGWVVDASTVRDQEQRIDILRRQKIEETLLREDADPKDLFIYSRPRNAITESFHVPPEIPMTTNGNTSSTSTDLRSSSSAPIIVP